MIVGFRILCRFLSLVNVPGEERVSDVYKNMPLESLFRKGFSALSAFKLNIEVISQISSEFISRLLSQQSISIRLSAQFT